MKLIRCTKKMADELDLKASEFCDKGPPDSFLGEWYCNIRRINRQKALLFTHADTLFSFWITEIKKNDLEDFGRLFLNHLTANLTHEGFTKSILQRATTAQEVRIGKTTSRSVLGSMNDFVSMSEYMIARAGGLQSANILEINKQLNRTPMSAIGMRFAIEALTEHLTGERITIRDWYV